MVSGANEAKRCEMAKSVNSHGESHHSTNATHSDLAHVWSQRNVASLEIAHQYDPHRIPPTEYRGRTWHTTAAGWGSIDANVSHSTWRLLETPAHYFEKVTFACGHRLQLLLVAKVPEERP